MVKRIETIRLKSIFIKVKFKTYIKTITFFMNGNTERAQCALSRVCIP